MRKPLRNSHARLRLLSFSAKRVGKFAACLILGSTLLSQSASAASNYAASVLADDPLAFWQLNEASGAPEAFDSSPNAFTATYGADGVAGTTAPQSPYLGFASGQTALLAASGDIASAVTLPPLSLNTNAVTIAMWINPSAAETASAGLLMNRNGNDAAGFGFGTTLNSSTSMAALGYTWNTNNGATWGFNSGLYPQIGVWQLAVLVITSNSATIYLDYLDPNNNNQPVLSSAVNAIAHTPESFTAGTILLGDDVTGTTGDSTRVFSGGISDAAVFNYALTADQVLALFAKGVGVQGFAPQITTQPISIYAISNSTAQFSANGINGTSPLSYQWEFNGTPLANSASYSGVNSNILTVLNLAQAEVGTYKLVVNNSFGSVTSSNATLNVQAANLVGEWLAGQTNFADVSGYSPTNTHDGYDAAGTGNWVFTNDVPVGKTGQSLLFTAGDTGLAISNSSTLDAHYTNTFDDVIGNTFTVCCWSRGFPTTWSPWVSKYGENAPESGWQLRADGGGPDSAFTVRNNSAGSTNVTVGAAAGDDMSTTTIPTEDGNWHFYVGVFNASTGVRSLYVDGQLAANESAGNVPYPLASAEHLCIGAKDSPPGNSFGSFSSDQIYDVRIYNYGLTQSNVLALYGVVPAAINTQPQSTSAFQGETVNLTVVAGGTPPLGYQWQFNGANLVNGAAYSGVNSNILTLINVTAADVGSYKVIVTNNYGTATSSNAAFTIVPKVLLGEWFTNGTLTDLSQHSPAGTHDGTVAGGGNYAFTNDVPLGESGQSLLLTANDTAIEINNTSTSDGGYTNTFDQNAITVAFWAKGRGDSGTGVWVADVSKDGYNNDSEYDNVGWSVGMEAWSTHLYSFMAGIDGNGIAYTLGDGLWGNTIMESSPQNLPGNDTTWHHYAVTYSPVTGTRNLYFDGTLVGQNTSCTPYTLAPAEHLVIGGQEQLTDGLTGFDGGGLFDVRIYNYQLTSNEVAALVPEPVFSAQPPQAVIAYIGTAVHITASVLTLSTPVTNQWQLNGASLLNGNYGGAIVTGANSTTLTITGDAANLQGTLTLVVSDPRGSVVSSNVVLTVAPTAPLPAANLVGAWLTGATNLADTSGYSPAGTHDGYGVNAAGTPVTTYSFTTDAPPYAVGGSLVLNGTSAISISNSSTLDPSYTNTFDDTLTNAFSVTFWAKGYPGNWNPWVSKYGEGPGWQMRDEGDNADSGFTLRGATPGTITLGSTPYGDSEDLRGTIPSNDSNWHFYAGTFDSVSSNRLWYVDGVLSAQVIDNGAYNLSPASHLAIGGKDAAAGNSFGSFFTGEIYGVKIYNTALTVGQVNYVFIVPGSTNSVPPVFNGIPAVINGPNGKQLVLKWSSGTLLEATNVLGPWTATGATSPYTNNIEASPQTFFRLSNP